MVPHSSSIAVPGWRKSVGKLEEEIMIVQLSGRIWALILKADSLW